MSEFAQTPSQTVGPFYGYALPLEGGDEVVPPWRAGSIRVHGTVFDGAGDPIPDAIVETWQADPNGRRVTERGVLTRDPYGFSGFGRMTVNGDGHWSVTTLKPGSTAPHAAPFVLVTVFARGLLHHLFTRMYFGDEEDLNANDPVLSSIDASRRSTMIAQPDGERSYLFDIRLQGEGETVFLDYGLGNG
ncbi:MAG: protocatechuate 3,4-dioxygenase subunit alpha [Pseudolysinimonas sp.]